MKTFDALGQMWRTLLALCGLMFFAWMAWDFYTDLSDTSDDNSVSILLGGGSLLLGFGTIWRLIKLWSKRQRTRAERDLDRKDGPAFDADDAIARYLASRVEQTPAPPVVRPSAASAPISAPPVRGFGRKGTFG